MPHFIVHLSHTGCYKRVLCILGAASRVLSDQHCSLTSVDTTDAAPRLPDSHRVSFNRGSTSDRMDAMTGRSANGSAASDASERAAQRRTAAWGWEMERRRGGRRRRRGGRREGGADSATTRRSCREGQTGRNRQLGGRQSIFVHVRRFVKNENHCRITSCKDVPHDGRQANCERNSSRGLRETATDGRERG